LAIRSIFFHPNGKIEWLGTRSVQWQEKRDLDIQTRPDQLGELKWSIRNLQIQGNFDRLLQSIENGTAYSGINGSYKDGHGTAAFRIQNDQGDKITGCNITPELQEQQSAYQSELYQISYGIDVVKTSMSSLAKTMVQCMYAVTG
jgi:hypothetical protein